MLKYILLLHTESVNVLTHLVFHYIIVIFGVAAQPPSQTYSCATC